MPTFDLRALTGLAAAAAALAAAPSSAHAAGFTCSASAVRATVLDQALEPVRAGAADGCPTSRQALDHLGAPLRADAASASTGVTGGRAMAATAVSGVDAGALSALSSALPQIAVPAGLEALPVPLPASAQLLGLPALLTVDAGDAARRLIADRALPDVPMMAADLVRTAVAAACQGGRTALDSLAVVEGLSALGRTLPIDRAVDTAVPLVDAQTVDFSTLDVATIALPDGLSLDTPVTGPILRAALEAAVAGLPAVTVPAEVGRVVVEPARREQGQETLRQLGPRVRVEALGRELVDVTLGDALVSAVGVICDVPAAIQPPPIASIAAPLSPATELALTCARADVALTDVVEKDGRVKLVGVAAAKYVGRTVNVVLTHTGRRVASGVVQPDGWFRTRAALPPDAIRWTNAARYQAVIDDQRSLALKLHRRMRISRMRPMDGKITIAGRIYGRRGGDEVVISRRESCTRDVEVTTVRPRRDGRWRVTLPIPEGIEAATYRATTRVRRGDNPKRFRTYTLPAHVAL